MQWKPHSCTIEYERQFWHKVQSMVLKIFICPSHIANWSLGLLESMGCNRHSIRALGSFLPEIFAYDQQVSFYLKISNSKDQILTQSMHKVYGKYLQVKSRKISDPYIGVCIQALETLECLLRSGDIVRLLYRLKHWSLHHLGKAKQGAWIETKEMGTNCWSLQSLSDPCTRRGF